MKKRIASVILALALSLLTATVVAAEEDTGSYQPYPEATYELTYTENADGTLTITGLTGSAEGELRLPDQIDDKTVTAIGDSAFAYCSDLTGSLVIPAGVTTIGVSAFAGCVGLTGILVIPADVTAIGDYAFYDCSGLTGLTIGNGVIEIGDYAFWCCSGLTAVTIPAGVTEIGYGAFKGCSALTAINVDPGNTYYSSIDGILYSKDGTELILYPMGKVGSLTIPAGVTAISDDAFGGCSGLTAIEVTPGNPAYSSVDGMLLSQDGTELILCPTGKVGSLTIPAGVTAIGSFAFADCSGLTGSLAIPDNVTAIDWGAFMGCSGLTGLTLGSGVTSIGNEAFKGCVGLTGILVIPDGVTKIGTKGYGYGYGAFMGCSGLTGLTLGSGVTSIGDDAFGDCSGLTAIEVRPGNPAYSSEEGMLLSQDGTELILCPKGKVGSLTIPAGVTTISDDAFYRCDSLTAVTIPAGVITISDDAFSWCSGLTAIEVMSGNPAYSSEEGMLLSQNGAELILCPKGKVGSLTIPAGVTHIGDNAFGGCIGLTGSLVIPDSVTHIGDYAFRECSGLTGLTLGASVTTIGREAFMSCSGLTGSLAIPDNVTGIGDCVFSGCGGFNGSLTIGKGMTSIEAHTFIGCGGFTSVTIPAGVTYIGNGAFGGCTSLRDVYYGGGEEQWNAIQIDSYGYESYYSNDSLLNAAIHYNSAGPEPGTTQAVTPYAAAAVARASAEINAADKAAVETAAAKTEVTGLEDAAARQAAEKLSTDEVNSAKQRLRDAASNNPAMFAPGVADAEDGTVRLYAQTYLDVRAKEYETTSGSEKYIVDITPMTRLVVSIATTADAIELEQDGLKNAILVSEEKLEVQEPVTVKIPLPAGFAHIGDELLVTHTLDDGAVYTYNCRVQGEDDNNKYIQFENLHGFSEFTLNYTAPTPGDFIPGDVTADGKVTRADLLRLAKHFSGYEVVIDEAASDVTADGKVTRGDLLRLAKYFSGYDVKLGSE